MRSFFKRLNSLLTWLPLFVLLIGSGVLQAQEQTITDIASNTDELTILTDALQAAELADVLDGETAYTVFAPTDQAFEAVLSDLDINAEQLLGDAETLRTILTYHVVEGAVFSDALSAGSVTTLNGASVEINLENGVMVNEARVITPDIEASNGVVHVIDRVLLPPSIMQPNRASSDDDIDPVSFVRLAHFSPDAPAVDIYIDGDVAVQELGYPDVTGFVQLPAGAYNIAVAPAGTSVDEALIADEYAFAAETWATVAVVGSLENETLAPAIFTSDYSDIPADDDAQIRVFHAIEGAPAVDVLTDDATLLNGLVYVGPQSIDTEDGNATLTVPADTYTLMLTETGNPENVLFTLEDITFEGGMFYLMAAVGTPDDPDITLIEISPEAVHMNDSADDPGTVVEVAQTADGFNILVDAIQAGGLTDTLNGDGPFTVFAPTDEAFENALGEMGITAADLLNNPELLTTILTYHVLEDDITVEDMIERDVFLTLNGEEIDITINNEGILLNGAVSIITPDIAASNGVIHVVDEVLLPPSMLTDN